MVLTENNRDFDEDLKGLFYCETDPINENNRRSIEGKSTQRDNMYDSNGNQVNTTENNHKFKPLTIRLRVQNVDIQFEIDTGASISAISRNRLDQISASKALPLRETKR